MKKILVAGGGGFIGGWLVKELISQGNQVTAVDVKLISEWSQVFTEAKNLVRDLSLLDNCLELTKDVDEIYNLAADMGGMGFIEKNKAACMLSVLINTHLLMGAKLNGVSKFFFASSACVYNATKQKTNFIPGLKEEDAYPADPEDGYGWEKLFSERMCRHFTEDFALETRVARYHNVYGPLGTYDGGREKAPAALCRKVIEAKLNKKSSIDVWGDGEQTRSFMFIKDCIIGTKMLFESKERSVLNIGSEEQVSINQMINFIEEISGYKVNKNYQLDKPKGVRGRSSNNDLIKKKIGWDVSVTLKEGLKETYQWIYKQMTSGSNNNKFSRKY